MNLDYDDQRIHEGAYLTEPNSFEGVRFHKAMRHCFFKSADPDNEIEETAEEKELAKIALEKTNLYFRELAPLEDLYMGKVDNLNSDASRNFATGAANQNTEKAFSNLSKSVQSSEANSGVDPNSARFKSRLGDVHTEKAAASSENQAMAEMAQEQDHVTGMTNINAMGVGQSTSAQGGFSRLAQNSANKAADDAEMEWNKSASRLQTASSAAGAGAYLYNNR